MLKNFSRKSRVGAAVMVCVLVAHMSLTAHAADASPAMITVPELETPCRPGILPPFVAKLSVTATMKELPRENVAISKMPGGTNFVAAANGLPAFCQVSGSFVTNRQTGKTANFLATFPAQWNGKYLQMGCSGHCGWFAVSNAATPFTTVTNQGLPGDILRKGYASFATDEGHVGFRAGAMENWVEKGLAPDALPATLYKPTEYSVGYGKSLGRAMPLCKFPTMARYSGKGDVNDAANWSCPADDQSMLEISESGRQAGVVD